MSQKRTISLKWCFSILVLGLMLSAAPAAADDWDFGLRGGVYNDISETFVGAELLTRVGHSGSWFFNPNIEYVLVDRGKLATFNLDFHYDFDTDGPVYLWLGGGPGLEGGRRARPRVGRRSSSPPWRRRPGSVVRRITPDFEGATGVSKAQGHKMSKPLAALDHFEQMELDEVPETLRRLVEEIYAP